MKQQASRTRITRRVAPAALIALLIGLVLTGADSFPLPGSVSSCLPCHDRGVGGQVGEWLASPYSEAEGGRGCTDCHGERCSGNGEAGASVDRSVGADLLRLREALLLRITAHCSGETVDVEVAVSNVGAGHMLPSPSGGRKMILEVAARDRLQALQSWPAGSSHLQLPPYATELSRYRFVSAHYGPVHVSARLMLEPTGLRQIEITNTSTVCISSGEQP
jgi:hypothetical protein